MRSFFNIIYFVGILSASGYYALPLYRNYETQSIIELLNKSSTVTVEKEISSFRSHEYSKEVNGKIVNVTDEMRCVRADFEDKVTGKHQTQYVWLNVESKFSVIVSEEYAQSNCNK